MNKRMNIFVLCLITLTFSIYSETTRYYMYNSETKNWNDLDIYVPDNCIGTIEYNGNIVIWKSDNKFYTFDLSLDKWIQLNITLPDNTVEVKSLSQDGLPTELYIRDDSNKVFRYKDNLWILITSDSILNSKFLVLGNGIGIIDKNSNLHLLDEQKKIWTKVMEIDRNIINSIYINNIVKLITVDGEIIEYDNESNEFINWVKLPSNMVFDFISINDHLIIRY